MDKDTYLRELARELSRWMPEQEKQDILRWYEEYFAEAGREREAEVIARLDAPHILAERLAQEGGWIKARRGGSRTVRAAVIAVLGVLLLAAALFGVMRSFRLYGPADTGTGWPQELSQEVDSFLRLDAELSIGDVTVRTGGDRFLVEAECSGSVNGTAYRVDYEVSDQCLRLNSVPESLPGGSSFSCQADVVITVPEGQTLEDVRISVGMGEISLSGLTAEQVRLETGMGNVDVQGTDAQTVHMRTGMGDLTFQGYPAGSMELDDGMGEISVGLNCGPNECGYQLTSGMGKVSVDGRGQGGSKEQNRPGAAYQLTALTGMGNVSLEFVGD